MNGVAKVGTLMGISATLSNEQFGTTDEKATISFVWRSRNHYEGGDSTTFTPNWVRVQRSALLIHLSDRGLAARGERKPEKFEREHPTCLWLPSASKAYYSSPHV
jgi:hypothetical protein